MKTCKHCGKEIPMDIVPSAYAKRVYCSRECQYHAWRGGALAKPRTCRACKTELVPHDGEHPMRFDKRKYCTQDCANQGKSDAADRRFERKFAETTIEPMTQTETMLALEPTAIPIVRREVRRVWNPIRHTWYVAEIGVVR